VPDDDLRVGDRFTQHDRKITIVGIDGDAIDFAVLTDDGRAWHAQTSRKAVAHWTPAGRGEMPAVTCPVCLQEDLEGNEMMCWTCAAARAGDFAAADSTTVAALIADLEEKTDGN
jgi:hypothetical protein